MYFRTAIMLAMVAVVGSAAELTIENSVVSPGAAASLNMRLAASGTEPTGLQFDVDYDSTALEIAVEAGSVAGSAGKNLQAHIIKPGKQRVLIIGFNKNAISDGVVAVLHVSLKGEAQDGKIFPVHLSATAGTNQRAGSVAITGTDGSIKVELRRKAL